MADPNQQPAPLSAAQIAVLEDWLKERREALEGAIEQRIADAIAPLQETIAHLQEEAVLYGMKIALRAANGQAVCASEGGPTEEHKEFLFVSRSGVEVWESFKVERGF